MGWRRVGSSAATVLMGTAMLTIGLLVAGGGTIAVLAKGWHAGWLVVGVLVTGLFVAFTCRLLMLGVYVSDTGVRVRTLRRTDSFGWAAVLAVRSRKITRTALESPKFVQVRQVCFDLADGRTIESPIHGMTRGVSRTWRMPDIVSSVEFDRLLAELRHLTATRSGQGGR
jgi:hypothetical protein